MLVRLRLKSSFANGLPRSDSLFGALCWGIRWAWGEQKLVDLLDRFKAIRTDRAAAPPFVVSSVFPAVNSQGASVRLLPMPLLPLQASRPRYLGEAKTIEALQDAQWVTVQVFNELVSGRATLTRVLTSLLEREDKYEIRGPALCLKDELPNRVAPVLVRDRLRSTMDRVTGASGEGNFFAERSTYADEAYFLAACDDEIQPVLQAALRLLGDQGIGGRTSTGRGAFDVEFEEDSVQGALYDATHFVTLSLLHPTADDLAHLSSMRDVCWYDTVRRLGRIQALVASEGGGWKAPTFNFVEGSTFVLAGDRRVYGWCPVVKTDPYEVLHNGLAYVVPARC